MSLKNVKKEQTNIVELEIAIGAEDFEKAVEAAYERNKDKISIPGFRKGKVTRKMVEKMYGEGFFYEDAVNALYPDYYQQAVEESAIKPVDHPEIEITKVDADGVEFTAKVTVYPEIEVGEYKGIKAVHNVAEVTDEDVLAELNERAKRASTLAAVEKRASKLGDTVIIDFEGFVDGVAFPGGKGEQFNLQLGSGQFIPGFEDQLVDKNAGDECDVVVTFPTEYQEPTLAGKEATFKCKVHEIKETIMPELDDEFAKDVSEFATLDELKADISKKILDAKQQNLDNQFESMLIDAIIADIKGEIPEVMYDSQVEMIASDYDNRLRMQGMDLKTYLGFQGMDMDSFKKMFREQAERQVKIRLALEKIVEKEQIVVDQAEIDAEYQSIADQYKMELDKVKAAVSMEEITKDLAVTKAIEMIKNNAVVVDEVKKPAAKKAKKAEDGQDEEKKPAAKKPAAKKTAAKKEDKAE